MTYDDDDVEEEEEEDESEVEDDVLTEEVEEAVDTEDVFPGNLLFSNSTFPRRIKSANISSCSETFPIIHQSFVFVSFLTLTAATQIRW